jgi:hypothetical protein
MSWCPQAFPEGNEVDPVPAGGSPQLCCEQGGGLLVRKPPSPGPGSSRNADSWSKQHQEYWGKPHPLKVNVGLRLSGGLLA